jgi:hypothetical protein
MQDPYVSCYFSGRFDAFDGEVDLDKLIEKVNSGQSMRDHTLEAARKAISADMDTATKAQWLKDNVDEIKELGGDSEKAWKLYCQGRTDALAHQLEEDVLESVEDQEEDVVEKTGDESDEDEDDDDSEDEDEED